MAGVLKTPFRTLITFGSLPNAELVLPEKRVTPMGYDGGGSIDVTTMRNVNYRTRWHKSLKTLTEMSFVAAYAVQAYSDLFGIVNQNQYITVAFPDLSTISFYGYLNQFQPNENDEQETNQPTANCIIIPTMLNAAFAEAGPVFNLT